MPYFMRLFILLSLLFLALAVIWQGLVTYGEQQPVSNFQTPLIEKLRTLKAPLVWLPAPTEQQTLWLQAEFDQGKWVEPSSQSPLETSLKKLKPHQFALLFFDVQSAEALPSLRKTVHGSNKAASLIFCSRSDGILKDLRELEPEWSYCSGEIFMTRMLGLSSIGLASLSPISADIFFIHLNEIKLGPSVNKLIQEGQRQKRLVFIGPIAEPHPDYPADGWVATP